MKKLFTFFTLAFVFTYAQAQRSCDLQCTQYVPGVNWEIRLGVPFDISVKMKNLGPGEIKPTDTILYLLKIDANYITSGGSPLGKAFYGNSIAVGGELTVTLFQALNFTTQPLDGTHQFCTETFLYNRATTDGATDPNTGNNTGCNPVIMNKYGVGVDLSNATDVSVSGMNVYPNPATNSATIEYVVAQTNPVKVVVRDIQGREVLSVVNENKDFGVYQKNIDISSLSKGIYIVEYTVGDQVITSKLVKQ
jgi:hypothetical protein